MNMYGLAFTQKAAGLYGLKSSAQGSGRKRFIIVRSTNRTQLLESAGQKRLRDMLAAHEDSLDVLKPGTQAALAYRGKYQKLDSLHPSSVRCTQLDSCGKPLTAPEGGLDLLRPGSQTTAVRRVEELDLCCTPPRTPCMKLSSLIKQHLLTGKCALDSIGSRP